ncbi:MAG TPA: response regulator transcription factor [Bellilinea sp.]|nr:response regulator transcription factor [Bellilinea sp.]
MAERILVVEDEATIRDLLVYNLKKNGYEVEAVDNGLKAVEAARMNKPNLILLDLMLPGIDGYEVCRILRQEQSTPMLMLTARDEEIDRVVGLEMGADDYITKPFSMRELMARVKAMLRRVRIDREETEAELGTGTPQEVYKFGNLEIDILRHEVRLNGSIVPTKPKEFELLGFLAKHRGQALSREFILERLWGWEYIGDSRTVDVHVRWLREKIEEDPANPKRVVTVRGAGYRFEG